MKFPPSFPLAQMVALTVSLSVSGCRPKQQEPASPAPIEQPAIPANVPAVSLPAATPSQPAGQSSEAVQDRLPTAPNDASLRYPVHQELTGAIHLYSMDYRKMPADFETLVKEKYLKALPKPPPGKRFALDRNRMQVVILD